LPLAKYIADDFGDFDPMRPVPLPAAFIFPPDPAAGRGGRAGATPNP